MEVNGIFMSAMSILINNKARAHKLRMLNTTQTGNSCKSFRYYYFYMEKQGVYCLQELTWHS